MSERNRQRKQVEIRPDNYADLMEIQREANGHFSFPAIANFAIRRGIPATRKIFVEKRTTNKTKC